MTTDPGPPSNPASQVTTDLERPAQPGSRTAGEPCEPYREAITAALEQGRNAKAIWQDLVDQHAFPRHYESACATCAGCAGAS